MNTSNTVQGPYVFISYSHHDETIAKHLARDLNARGVHTWIDETGINPGSPDWDSTLRQAIDGAFAFILIASPNISNSSFVKGEVAIAKAQSCNIYPVWAHGTDWVKCVPINLINTQYIDMRGQLYAVGLDKLVAIVTRVQRPQSSQSEDRVRQKIAPPPPSPVHQQMYAPPVQHYANVPAAQSQYNTPVHVGKKRSMTLWIVLASVIGVLLLCSIASAIAASLNSNQSSTSSTTLATLTTFCNAIKNGDYPTAYNQLSTSDQSATGSESHFAALWNPLGVTDCTVVSANDSTGTGSITYSFVNSTPRAISYILVKEGGVWKIAN